MKRIFTFLVLFIVLNACSKKEEISRGDCAFCGLEPLNIPNWNTTVFCQDLIRSWTGSINFPTENIGYAGGLSGGLIKTVDGGKEWMKLDVPTTNHVKTVYFLNNSKGWAIAEAMGPCLNPDCGKGNILLRTEDGGVTWEKHFITDPLGLFSNLYFFNASYGIANVYFGPTGQTKLMKTTDGGLTWNTFNLPINNNHLSKLQVLNNTTAYTFGGDNRLNKSVNSGRDWETLSTPVENFRDFYFVTENLGFISGINNAFKTKDGGKTWIQINLPGQVWGNIHFRNETQGFLVVTKQEYKGGDFPELKMIAYSTEDGGQTWVPGIEKMGSTSFYYPFSSDKGFFQVGKSVIKVER